TKSRLEGLDLARLIAFVGMVIVNFKIVMGADGGDDGLSRLTAMLEGRAAATFVVLAGIGLGLFGLRSNRERTVWVTMKRAAFLLVIGLLNMLIFDADILHYYAFYFLFGALLLSLSASGLAAVVLLVNLAFLVMTLLLDYDAGWNWDDLTYQGFWTPVGFVRNLFFNGWHPVFPWLSFLLFGMLLSRFSLAEKSTHGWMVIGGVFVVALAEWVSSQLSPVLTVVHPELVYLAATAAIPPTPLYILSGMGIASVVIGLCLLSASWLSRIGLLAIVSPAGRQTLTLYIAHIILGMGVLDGLGLLGGQSIESALVAASVFCAATVVYALFWSRYFKHGPIETAMRRIAG
ncbi:MAG: DUF418 domain-containing protein, partial [Chromatiales bacterium]|nr:DUF418 domain-containing protein [Chromatiales bacterium]